MRAFVLKRRAEETVVVAFLIALFGLGLVGSFLGGLAAADAAQFWQNFVGGIALLVVMTLPIWFLQRWLSMARPSTVTARLKEIRRISLVLLVLWIIGIGIASFGLAINVSRNASIEANVAVGLFIAYLAGWGLLVFRVLSGVPLPAERLRLPWFGAKTK